MLVMAHGQDVVIQRAGHVMSGAAVVFGGFFVLAVNGLWGEQWKISLGFALVSAVPAYWKLQNLIFNIPLVRASKDGIWLGGKSFIPWTQIKSLNLSVPSRTEPGSDEKNCGNRVYVQFTSNRVRKLLRWEQKLHARFSMVGDYDFTVIGSQHFLSDFQAMQSLRAQALSDQNAVTVRDVDMPIARVHR
jgi:hypothetical protein